MLGAHLSSELLTPFTFQGALTVLLTCLGANRTTGTVQYALYSNYWGLISFMVTYDLRAGIINIEHYKKLSIQKIKKIKRKRKLPEFIS